MSVAAEPLVSADSVTFRLPDAEPGGHRALDGARLLPDLSLADTGLDFHGLDFDYADDAWQLTLDRPPVRRMEYRFQLRHLAGDLEEICDPGNPLRAPGAFGDKSVVEFPDYTAPAWLSAERVAGERLEVAERVTVWTPAAPDEPLPLLVAHDGPEYDRLAGLTGFLAALVAAGRLPRCRVALLAPGVRDEEYSADPYHSALLHQRVLPGLRDTFATTGPVVGMGASLGGLAMLHAQRALPSLFGGLFLQSASFLTEELDQQENGRFSKFAQVNAYVQQVLAEGTPAETVPTVLTCGLAEENLANNRQMAATLAKQGYPSRLVEVPDAHNYVGWRDAFDPALADLLRDVWEA
ncbi:MAG: esterase [Actinophytocola sp.]|uniref:alpha/beta hydrolase n=1 Tax=Actinophytocola sp. TaxID=1872138 RepID=UPI001324F997|nr:alpha/beta hydrolase-fold protein [Actinophytocola sp.]MPZ83256.1 esterase [Actinophytocola sp.]